MGSQKDNALENFKKNKPLVRSASLILLMAAPRDALEMLVRLLLARLPCHPSKARGVLASETSTIPCFEPRAISACAAVNLPLIESACRPATRAMRYVRGAAAGTSRAPPG